jgi:xanthine dehydrogenase small subunit
MPTALVVDGRAVEVDDDGVSLLEALRDRCGARSPKDGCSPQGQCGCCTVLVDGQPRVACVTPVRRMAGRHVVTLDGFDDGERRRWAEAFTRHGASQCGFCTPGIIVRLAALSRRSPGPLSAPEVEAALGAHLCRCTGWRTIVDAALDASGAAPVGDGRRDPAAASRRASIEGGAPRQVGPEIALGHGGFADDLAPQDALVAVLSVGGEWVVGETLAAARAAAGKIQGRRTTAEVTWPLEVPPGDWDVALRTTWVEPAYLEPDASWCRPGERPVSPLANGGAFGGKAASPVGAVARELADRHGRPVRVVLAREDVVRLGPKRPPIAAGLRQDGSGTVRVVRTPGVAAVLRRTAPGVVVEEVDVPGPPTSLAIRGAGWAEVAAMAAALSGDAAVTAPSGGWARATVEAASTGGSRGAIRVQVAAGPPLDEVVLRSYCVGAAHQALGWVTSEAISVGEDGVPADLTIRSFGILRARDVPPVTVEVLAPGPPGPVEAANGSDAVFAAVAAAAWIAEGLPPAWPTNHRRTA